MRSIFDRYIFAQLLPPFVISVGGLCFVMLTKEMLRLVELLVAKGVGLVAVAKVVLYLLPSFLVLTLPIAALIASITTFSHLSYDRELVAMRAAGLSVLRLSRPVLVFSCLVFGATFALSYWGQPWSNVSLKKLALSVLRDHMTLALEKGVFNEPIPRLVVYVADNRNEAEGTRGIFISDERNPREARLIVAARYQLLQEPGNDRVSLRLFDGGIHSRSPEVDTYEQGRFSTYDLALPLDRGLYSSVDQRPSRQAILQRLEQTNWEDTGARKRLMESYKDLAFPTAALLLGILGVPVGIVSRRSGRIGGFVVGVIIIVGYYLLNVLCEFLVVTRALTPFAGAWVPNLLVLMVAMVLYSRRAGR